MASEVFRGMPNSTDLSVLKRGGLQGLDFAFAGDAEVYHSAKDDVAHLDRRSVQEQGGYALLLTRRFGEQDLKERRSSTDAIFFTSQLTNLIEYPASWALPLACVVGLLLVIALWVGWRRHAQGLWIVVPLSLILILTFLSVGVPAMSYLVQLPMLAATLAFTLLVTAPDIFGIGWRLYRNDALYSRSCIDHRCHPATGVHRACLATGCIRPEKRRSPFFDGRCPACGPHVAARASPGVPKKTHDRRSLQRLPS